MEKSYDIAADNQFVNMSETYWGNNACDISTEITVQYPQLRINCYSSKCRCINKYIELLNTMCNYYHPVQTVGEHPC